MNISVIAKSVPAICIAFGSVAVFFLDEKEGWFLILIGVGLQVLFLRKR